MGISSIDRRLKKCPKNHTREFKKKRLWQDLKSIESTFRPRRKQGQRYPLKSVIVIALMAIVCGCDDGESIELWGEINAEWLSRFLELPYGPPTQDLFLDVFAALNPAAFSALS